MKSKKSQKKYNKHLPNRLVCDKILFVDAEVSEWQTSKIQVLVEATLYRFKSATRTTSEQRSLCSAFLCMKNIRLQTADVFTPFRERLYFIRRNIAIRNDNIIFL